MRLLIKKQSIFLISLILCGCIPFLKGSPQPAEKQQPSFTAAATIPIPTPVNHEKDFLLIKTLDQQFYISDLKKNGMTPVGLPANLRAIALSPNGNTIAYVPNEDPALYLFNISTKRSDRLINSDKARLGSGLAWSPDGQKIAFSCGVPETSGFSLCLIDIAHKDDVQILVKSESLHASDVYDGVYSPAWDQAGQKIVFLSSNPAPNSGGKIVPPRDIWLFDISKQTINRIFSDGSAGITLIFNPDFLPGDDSILFSGRKEKFNTIFRYELNTQKLQNITSSDNSFDIVNFVLSPDGKSFLVSIPEPGNSGQDYMPTVYSDDGQLLEQLPSLKNAQVYSWGAP
jgi:WD40 repeat protein